MGMLLKALWLFRQSFAGCLWRSRPFSTGTVPHEGKMPDVAVQIYLARQ
ncbi:hypothetical protein [Ensifer soli]